MLRGVRPTTPDDALGIARVLADSGLYLRMPPAEMRWRYWQARADWSGPRSFVVVRDSTILAHAAIVPGGLLWDGGRAQTLHLIDWAARPDAIGAGVALMKYARSLADALIAIGGSAQTLKIAPELGFKRIGEAAAFVRPLRPLRVLGGVQGPGWKLLPRAIRSAYWSASAPKAGSADGRARRVVAGEIAMLAERLPVRTQGLALFERSPALFEHVLSCPVTAIELYAWERSPQARGYFLLAFAPAQARLVDFSTDSSDPLDWRSLVQCAVHEARKHTDAAEVVALASEPLTARALRESGFHVRGAQPIQLLASRNSSIEASSVRVQMLDNDAAYSHQGRADLWA